MTKRETYITKQAKRLSKGQIDRRRFVMSALATGVTMPTAMSLASRAEAAIPKPGGHLRYGAAMALATDRADLSFSGSGVAKIVHQACGDTLVDYDHSGTLVGALADQFGSDDGGLTWVFDLRRGVTFHSGAELTADDVLASLTFVARVNPSVRGVAGLIADARRDGDARVILNLHQPHQNFAALLADPHFNILPKDQSAMDGTGAYRLQRFEPGVSAQLIRNENDWRFGRGHFDSIDIRAMPDAGLRQSAVMNGEVDVIDDVDPRVLAMLSNMTNVDIFERQGARHHLIHMRLDRGPFADPHLRAALKAAVNRQTILDEAVLGHGSVGHDAPWFIEPSVSPYDPDKARWHRAASGLSGPVTLALPDQDFPGAKATASLVARAASDIGLDVRVQALADSTDWHLLVGQGNGYGDAHFAAHYMPQSGVCETGWVTTKAAERFSAQVQAARCTSDESIQNAQMSNAARTLARDGGMLLPIWANDLFAHATVLARPTEALSGHPSAVRILDSWWFS